MAETQETYGKGGAGNVGPASAAHTVEHHAGEPGNVTGRGGEGNIAAGAGHYDESGGHHVSASAGKGGLGNLHSKKGHDRKTSVVDQIIGSTLVTIGKVTKNTGLVEKGTARKAGPAPAPTEATSAPATAAA